MRRCTIQGRWAVSEQPLGGGEARKLIVELGEAELLWRGFVVLPRRRVVERAFA